MTTHLRTLLAQFSPVPSPADAALAEEHFQPLTVRRHAVLEEAAAVPAYLYFVAEGYLRLHYLDEQGADATTHLARPGDWLTPFQAFIHQQPARETLRAVTDCTLLRIRHADLAACITTSPGWQRFSLQLFERGLAAGTRRADALATRTAAQRYQELQAQYPDLLLHVPVQYLASYLGIQPESLSRLRRRIS